MPQVPSYDLPTQLPSLAAAPVAQVQAVVPMKNFSGEQTHQMGQAMQGVGLAAVKIAQRLQNEADDSAAREMFSRFSKKADNIELEYSALHGKAAVDQTVASMKAVDTAFDVVSKEAANDTQRGIFGRAADVRRQQAGHGITAHSLKEKYAYDDASIVAQIGALGSTASLHVGTWRQADGALQVDLAAAIAYSRALGKHRGDPDENSPAQKALDLTVTDNIHKNSLTSLIDARQFTEARDYLGTYRLQIAPATALHVEKALQIGTDVQKSQEAADRIWNESKHNITAALKKAEETFSGKERDDIVARLKASSADEVAGKHLAETQSSDRVYDAYAKGLPVSPVDLAAMSGTARLQFEKFEREDSAAKKNGEYIHTDPEVFSKISHDRFHDPNFFNKSKYDLRQYYYALSPSDRRIVEEWQLAGSIPNSQSADGQINDVVKSMGLTHNVAGKFEMDVHAAFSEASRSAGTAGLTYESRAKIMNRIALSGGFAKLQAEQDAKGADYPPDPDLFAQVLTMINTDIVHSGPDQLRIGNYKLPKKDIEFLIKHQAAEWSKNSQQRSVPLSDQASDAAKALKLTHDNEAKFKQAGDKAFSLFKSITGRLPTQDEAAFILKDLQGSGEYPREPWHLRKETVSRYMSFLDDKDTLFVAHVGPQATMQELITARFTLNMIDERDPSDELIASTIKNMRHPKSKQ